MTSAGDLLALQEIDLNRDSRRALIADIDYRLVESEELIAARELVQTREAELASLQRRQRELEASLTDMDAKVQPLETKLYGGSVRNPKELSALQHEVEALKAKRGELDEEGLLNIDAVEAALKAAETARADLTGVEAAWQADQAQLIVQRTQAERESASLDEERQRRIAGMDAGALGIYESLRTQKQGKAVAVISRGACQGCRISLPTNVAQRARGGMVLVQCPSCERILAN